MAFDGLVLYALVQEAREKLINARVDKIYQPDPDMLTIAMRGRGENVHLLFSANAQYNRIHFTDEKFANPPHPPAFCMLMRKYLSGGRVIEVHQPGFERIFEILIQNINEEGELATYRLIAEMMGRHSNLILVDEKGDILDGIKRIPEGISRHREVLPGRPYINPPEQDKANPLMAEEPDFKALLQLDPEAKLFQAIMNNYRGISPLIAKEIVFRAKLPAVSKIGELTPTLLDTLWQSFQQVFQSLRNTEFIPTLVEDTRGSVIAYSCINLEQFSGLKQERFTEMSQLLDYYFSTKVKKQALNQISGDLKKTISNLYDKAVKKYDKLTKQMSEAHNAEDFRIKGEMLKANIHLVEKGTSSIKVVNYYDPDLQELTIDLDPAVSPQVNAQKYFKRYNKLKNSIAHLIEEIAKLDIEIEYLGNVELSLEQIESKLDLEEIREELMEEGYLKDTRKSTPNRNKARSKPMKFRSSDGFDILVGRNNRQNDELSKKIAARDDLWFHTKEIPGSHVIIRNYDRKPIPQSTIHEGAILSAYFSKARQSVNVQVDYTQIKNVNKPKGAKPGMVIYVNNQTLVVNPDEKIVESLREKTSGE